MTTKRTPKKSTAAAAATPSNPKTATKPPTSGAGLVAAPPGDVNIPAIPQGFAPVDIRYYTGILPKAAQLAVMPGVVDELKDFTEYAAVFGKTAPPYASVVQAFEVAFEWSALRAKLDAFDVYSVTQEAIAWKQVHDFMVRMRPAFELVVQSDSTVGTTNPSLVRLFAAQKEIAQKGVSTKKANAQLAAEGKLPTKGRVGARRKRVAANALLAASQSASAPVAAAQVPPTHASPTNESAPSAATIALTLAPGATAAETGSSGVANTAPNSAASH